MWDVPATERGASIRGISMSRATAFRASLLASVLMLSVPAFAEDVVKEQSPSEISIAPDGGNFKVSTVNRRYETNMMASTLGGPDLLYQMLLIEESRVSHEGPDTEGEIESAKVKVTAFPLSKDGKAAKPAF